MGFNGIGAAMLTSVLVVIAIAIFIMVLNNQSATPACAKTGAQVNLLGNSWTATSSSLPVSARANSGSNLVKIDGSHCSTAPTAATNANTWYRTGFGLLASSDYTLTLTIFRLISAIAGLGVIVVIWRAAMVDNG